jgi:hypothetical protein
MADSMENALVELRSYIRRDVRAGFHSLDDILELAIEVIADEGLPAESLRPHAERFLAEELVRLQEEAKSWPETTDCDRLDRAFAELEANGIVARQNFTCCQTCGHAEIGEQIENAMAEGRAVEGYTFFHQQDTEAAVDEGGMHLAYGALEEGEGATAAIGRRVADTLGRHGLAVQWDGSVKTRIQVSMQWRKRLS